MLVDVDDSSGFDSQNTMKLYIFNSKGESIMIECCDAISVDKLKIMALGRFNSDQVTYMKMSNQFKLISVCKKKNLNDNSTLRDEEVVSGETLLLVAKYTSNKSDKDLSKKTFERKPCESLIDQATSSLKPKNVDHEIFETEISSDFQRELRKVLISLVDYAEKLLRNHPDVQVVLKDIDIVAAEDSKQNEDNEIDPNALKQLTDMGFPVERSKRALKLNNMSALESMDWLLAYESSSSTSFVPYSTVQVTYENTDIYAKVPAIVESYRSYKRKHFKPSMKAFNTLKQLGFKDNEVLDALWIHSNNESTACEWLFNDRRPKHEDLQRGLKKESPIYKAVISNPTVQLGLMKPKIFFAFLQLIEEPHITARWLNDVETSPVISQIFRIYHSEKHAGNDEGD